MKNKKFTELIDDYLKLGLISLGSHRSLTYHYNKVDEDVKKKWDEYSQVILDDFLSRNKNESMELKHLDSIRKNVQFFAWLAIVSLVGYAIVALIMSSNF